MSGDFSRAIVFTLREEGGNVDDKDDPGGRTSRGVTQTNWDAFCVAMKWPQSDVWLAPQAHIILLYEMWYWPKVGGDALGWPLDLAAFDTGVLHGTARARAWVAAAKRDAAGLIALREASYEGIVARRPTSRKYLADWLGRCARLRTACGVPPRSGV